MSAHQRDLLLEGAMVVEGRMPYSSNATMLVTVHRGDEAEPAVYKPVRGERPLWDFPAGIARREAAAYELADALGWDLIPTTVLRDDAPLGEGSVQWFVPHDPDDHYFALRDDPAHDESLRRLCAFDLVANNTDRKGGHVLLGEDGRVWGIDNALCFHAEFKVRTVIWDYAGQAIPDDDLAALRRLCAAGLPDRLAALLDPFERDAVLARSGALAEAGVLPHDPTGRRYPWPLV